MALLNDRRSGGGITQVEGLACRKCGEAGHVVGGAYMVGGSHGMLGYAARATHSSGPSDHPFKTNPGGSQSVGSTRINLARDPNDPARFGERGVRVNAGVSGEKWANQGQGAPDPRSRLRRIISAI